MSNPMQRVRDSHDEQTGLSVWACDDGVKHAWLELEVPNADGTTQSIRLTRAEAEVLESSVLAEALPRLRSQRDLQRLNRQPGSLSALSATIAGITEARQPVEPAPPTVEEYQDARRAREQRISRAQASLQKAKESAGHYHRHKLVATELAKQLTQARALDSGLDLSAMEAEFEQVSKWAEMLPGELFKVAAAESEVSEAHRWNGFNHE